MSRSAGHCNVMGTASTMNSMAEALGMSLPGCAAIPAADSRRKVIAQLTGRRAVQMVHGGPAHLQDPQAREFPQRGARQRRARRLDQRGDPPDRDRRTGRGRVRARRLGPLRPRGADAGRHHAVGALPDGGLLLRGRPAGSAQEPRRARPARQERADRHRPLDLGQRQGRAELGHRGDPDLRQPAHGARRDRDPARQPRARTGRSSSPRQQRPS